MRQFKLFISYAHADFEPRPGFNDSRVGQILDDVKFELGCHSSRARFKILRDAENLVKLSENFRHRINEAIAECDMAIVFLSPHYCDSDECELELTRLIEAGKSLFLIETEDVWFGRYEYRIKRHREALKDILNVHFWGIDKDQKTVCYGWPMPHSDFSLHRDKYVKELQIIVSSLKARAAALLGAGDDEDEAKRHYTVFMACPTPDTKPEVNRLTSALEKDGHTVLAFDPELDIRGAEPFNETLSRALARCDVYVQLLGATPGRKVAGGTSRLVRSQYETAIKSAKQVYIWRSSDFDIAECEPEYAAFLTGLTCHLGNFLEFEEYLRKKLNDIAARYRSEDRRAQRSQEQEGGGSLPLIGIDAALSDRDLAAKITDALGKYVNVDSLPYELDSKSLAEAVADNNALILAYGNSSEGQKRAQAHFKIIRRQKAEANFKALELAVGNGASPTAPPCPRGPNVHIIAVADEVDSSAMFDFLKRLGVSISRANEVR